MSLDWKPARLGDLVETQKGYAFKSGWYSDNGRPIVKVSDFTADSVDSSALVCIPEAIAADYLKYKLETGDVVIQTVGSWPTNPASVVGKCVRIPHDASGALLNQNAVKLSPSNGLTRSFLYYRLRSDDFKTYIIGTAQGAASQAAITLEAIRAYDFDLPPHAVQHRIAGILSAYDELMENCQRRIRILEEMARALYREWFVHFRFPGHDKVPRVDSPLGPIPKGWEVKKLGDVADIRWGDTSTTKASYVEEGYAAYSASGSDGKLDHYDFDQTGIVLSAIGAQCGKTWLARGKWSCIKNTIRFWSKNECASTEFLFIATEGQGFWPRRGAAQPFISQGDAERIDIVIPDRATMSRFTTFTAASLERIATLAAQIQNLRLTRDLLLPRLLSGDLINAKF